MKKSSMAWTLISILLLCGVSLTSILFCFQMKVLGFSLMELVVIMSTVILLNILIAMIVLYPYQAASTLVCVSILQVQLIALMVLLMTVLSEWLQMTFML